MAISGESAIRVENLSHTYRGGARPALDNVTLSIEPGDFFGLLGRNGAGKTTLVSILCGLIDPSEGRVAHWGEEGVAMTPRIRRRIGLVPQHVALYPALTVRENLEFFGGLYGLRGKRLRERIDACMELTRLTPRADRRVEVLSGGMMRLTNVAAALLHEPDLLILDEPTLGIDAHVRHDVIDSLAKLNRRGVTLLYTTHYLEEVENLFTRAAIFEEGRVLAEGPVSEILAGAGNGQDLEDVFLRMTSGEDAP